MDEMIFYFKADGDKLTLLNIKNTAYTGNINTYGCEFEFTEEWNELSKFMAVMVKDKCYVLGITDNYCILPYEAVTESGTIQIGVYGTNGSEDDFKRISTNWESISVGEGTYKEDTSAPQIPEPDVWETLLNRNIPQIGENGNWYIWEIKDGKYIDSGKPSAGKQGDKGERGPQGEPGYTPVKGVDYFTPEDIASLGLEEKEEKSNKTDTLSDEESYGEAYPTADAVMFYVQGKDMAVREQMLAIEYEKLPEKEDKSNKVTQLSNSATDEQYPSAAAVYEHGLLIQNGVLSYTDSRIAEAESDIDDINNDMVSVKDDLRMVKGIAEGTNIAKAFDTYADFIAWADMAPDASFFQSMAITNYYMPIGNNIMIKTLNVPDLWVMEYAPDNTPLCEDITQEAQTAGMTLDEYIVYLLKEQGYFETKWLKLAQLETQKVDLTEYYTKEQSDERYLLQKGREKSGKSISITGAVPGTGLINYSIWGKCLQETQPVKDSPQEVLCVGDLVTESSDENYGKYKIAYTYNGAEYSIYLEEPLRGIVSYGYGGNSSNYRYILDYIDFKSQKVIRNVKEETIAEVSSIPEQGNIIYITAGLSDFYVRTVKGYSDMTTEHPGGVSNIGDVLSNCVQRLVRSGGSYVQSDSYVMAVEGYNNIYYYWDLNVLGFRVEEGTESDYLLKTPGASPAYYNVYDGETKLTSFSQIRQRIGEIYDGKDFKIYYPLKTPAEESIEIPEITVPGGGEVSLTVNTQTEPEKVGAEYYADISQEIKEMEEKIEELTKAVLSNGGNI